MITGEQLWDALKINGFHLPLRKRGVRDNFDTAADEINRLNQHTEYQVKYREDGIYRLPKHCGDTIRVVQ